LAAAHQRDEIVGVADELVVGKTSTATLGPLIGSAAVRLPVLSEIVVEHRKRHVGEQGRCHASNAMGNFCFEVTLNYRRLERPWRVSGTE
jgi:hypothetical protein